MSAPIAHSEDARRLKARLRTQLRWLRARLLGNALLMLLGGVGLLLAATVVAQPGWVRGGSTAAHVIRFALVAVGVWVLVVEAIRPLRRLANLKGFSRALEEHGEYGNLLEAATQFTSPKRKDPRSWGASPDLVAEILRRAREEAEAAKLAPRIPLAGAPLHLAVTGLALAVWLVLGLAAPDRVRDTFAGLAHPAWLDDPGYRDGIHTLSGDLRIPVGAEASLAARDLVGGAEPVYVQINHSGDFWREEPTALRPAASDPAAFRDVEFVVRDVKDPFQYRFRKGDALTRAHQVEVRERPVLTELAATLEPPAYTGRPTVERDDLGGTISVLEGTRVSLRGRASSPLREARHIPDEGPTRTLSHEGDTFTDQLVVTGDLSFRIGLEDTEGLANEGITVYRFTARPDDPPTVQLTRPGEDLTLERDLVVGVEGLAADDVGLAELAIVYRLGNDTEWSRLPLWPTANDPTLLDVTYDAGATELVVSLRWDVNELGLFPGDTVLYALEATDNNALVGGQTSRSDIFRLRLPTIAEVFDLERMEREEQGDEMAELLDEGEELKDTLERLERELKKNPNPDWAKQQEIRDALERQQALQERLEQSADELQQSLDDFQRNNAGSMEIVEKMQTIQDLMESIQDESLQAYMEAIEEAMEEIRPHELQRAMEEALESQEDQNRRLDRTIELLRQLERERTMSDLVEEVAEYLERQEQLERETRGETGDEEGEDATDGDEGQEGEDADGESGDEDGTEGEESGESGESGESEESDSGDTESEGSEGEESDGSESESGESSESESGESSESESGESGQESEPRSDEELAEAQERLAEEAKELEERLRETLEELKRQQQEGGSDDPGAQEMRESLEQTMEQMSQEGKSSESMEKAQEALQEGDREKAQEEQEGAQRQLLHLYQVLAEGQQSMQMASQQFATEKLQQTAYDLLDLSFGEEKVIAALEDGTRGQRTAPLAREQGRIHRNTERISDELHELARKNFMISERLLAQMRDLAGLLEESVEELTLSRSRRSRTTAIAGMGQMNRIVMNLLTAAMNSSGQGGGGGGQGSTSQQMQQLSMEQSRLNAMTQELRKKMSGGGLSQQERQQLAQLRAQQEAIQQQLQEIRGGIDDERRILGDLDQLEGEIEDVVEQMEGGRISPELERRQEKILSRMLEAQRSIREREFAKKRESQQGRDLFATQEGRDDPTDPEARERQLRRWLAPEKAPHAYQDDVRRYFRRIQGELDGGTRRP